MPCCSCAAKFWRLLFCAQQESSGLFWSNTLGGELLQQLLLHTAILRKVAPCVIPSCTSCCVLLNRDAIAFCSLSFVTYFACLAGNMFWGCKMSQKSGTLKVPVYRTKFLVCTPPLRYRWSVRKLFHHHCCSPHHRCSRHRWTPLHHRPR